MTTFILGLVIGAGLALLGGYYQATRAKTKALADKLGEAIDRIKK